MRFTKMQGIGNDYIYINCFKEKVEYPSMMAAQLSNRHFGIGSDGLVLIMPSKIADFRMRMFNSDGSESEMCGNAIRCVGKYVYDHGMTKRDEITVETLAGIKVLKLFKGSSHLVESVKVDMGEPVLESISVPVMSKKERVIDEPLEIDNVKYNITCVSMGNPHAVVFIDNMELIKIEKLGPIFERHPIFPKRTNTEFIKVMDRNTLEMRVWERGAGETLACGTGACAAVVAAVVNGYTERKVTVMLLGGDLEIEWNEKDNHVYMTGPAVKVFDGEFECNNC